MGACASKFSVLKEEAGFKEANLQVNKSIKKDEELTALPENDSKRQMLSHLLKENERERGSVENTEKLSEQLEKAAAAEANPSVNEWPLESAAQLDDAPNKDDDTGLDSEIPQEKDAKDVKSAATENVQVSEAKASQKKIDDEPVENAKQHKTAEKLVGIQETERPQEYGESTPHGKSALDHKSALTETENTEVHNNNKTLDSESGKKGMETESESPTPPEVETSEKSKQQIKPASEVDKKKPDEEEKKPVESTCEKARDEYGIESLKIEMHAESRSNKKAETQTVTSDAEKA